MDREVMERLEELFRSDEICRAYGDSARELEDAYDRIAESLPPEERRVLVGYRECMQLRQLRERTLVCEKMRFME